MLSGLYNNNRNLSVAETFAPKDYTAAIKAHAVAAGWGDLLDHFQNYMYLLVTHTRKYVNIRPRFKNTRIRL